MTGDAALPGGSSLSARLAMRYLRSVLASAPADPQPARAARRLMKARTHFDRDSARLTALWPAFLEAVLAPRIATVLSADELTSLERTARLVHDFSAGRLSPEQTWRPVCQARDTLAEMAAAPAVLRELWQATPAALTSVWRVTSELAQRHRGGEDLSFIYAQALRDVDFLRGEPGIASALAGCLAVDSRSDHERARRAAELARYLRSRRIYVPASDRALGFALLADEDYHAAEWHLSHAYASGQRDSDVLAALLSVLVRTGHAAEAAALARAARPVPTAMIAELAELSEALSWLDDLTADGPPPVSSARLRELSGTEIAAEWLRYSIGRLCLIEGDARSAAEILAPLARGHLDRPDWAYHAAAALALCGDQRQVAELWEATRSRQSAWPVGCQLLDIDTGRVDSVLRDGNVPPAYADTVAARKALSSWAKPSARPPARWLPGGGTSCEDIEAFRTSLGLWLLDGDQQALLSALSSPVFAHLPAAERMLWAAISVLPRYADGGQAMLLRAARLGHPRAALVLAVLRLAAGSPDVPSTEQPSIRSNLPELLHAWSDASAGRHTEAQARLTRLAEAGDARAAYALAAGDLLTAGHAAASGRGDDAKRHATAAANRLTDLLTSAPTRFDDEAKILLRCAEMMAGQASPAETSVAASRDQVPGWPPPSGSAWFQWLAAVARLSAGDGIPDLETARFLADALDRSGEPPVPVIRAVATLITRACLASQGPDAADMLIGLVSRLAWRLPGDQTARRLYGKATAALMRARDTGPAASGSAFTGPAAGGSAFTGSKLAEPSLVLAERALRAGEAAAAVKALRSARPSDDAEARLCHVLADLAEGQPPPADLPDVTGLSDTVAAVLRAGSAMGRDPLAWGKSLLTVVSDRNAATMVDLRANLPALCAAIGASRDRDVPVALGQALGELARHRDSELTTAVAARCATAIRDYETAHRLWVRTLYSSQGKVPPTLRDEAAAALRYSAMLARRQGDEPRAIWSLRVAAEHDLADALELQLAAERLIGSLFPRASGRRAHRPGRYRVLEEAIEDSRALKTVLAADNTERARAAWASCLREHADDLRFLHAVAVLYREHALTADHGPAAGETLTIATTLWSLLLSTDAFWKRFPGATAQVELTDRVLDDLLAAHAAIGMRALDAADKSTATDHFKMLVACAAGHDALAQRFADQLGTGWRRPQGASAWRVRELADRYLAEWGTAIARAARSVLDDTSELDLPAGITKNYEGAVDALEPFADLGMRARREVAVTGLQFCNDWCFAYAMEPDGEGIRVVLRVLKIAGKFADQLIRATSKGQAEREENQVISSYYQLRAWAAEGNSDKCRYYTEALEWNPSNAFAIRRKKKYCEQEQS